MSETTTAATEPQGSTQTTSDAAAAGGGASAPWYEGFKDFDPPALARLQRLGSPEDAARSLINAEKRLGVPEDQLMRLPSDPKDDKAMRAIYAKLGLPDKPEGYNIQLDAKATDADKAVLGDFLKVAHEAGAPTPFVQKFAQWWQSKGAEAQAAQQRQDEEARAAGEAELKTAWGQKFDTYAKEIGRFARDKGGPELAAELDAGKLGSHPQLAKMLAAMIDERAEPGNPGGRSGDAARMTGAESPTEARAGLAKLNGDPILSKALLDKTHPQHDYVLKERRRLQSIVDGREPGR